MCISIISSENDDVKYGYIYCLDQHRCIIMASSSLIVVMVLWMALRCMVAGGKDGSGIFRAVMMMCVGPLFRKERGLVVNLVVRPCGDEGVSTRVRVPGGGGGGYWRNGRNS